MANFASKQGRAATRAAGRPALRWAFALLFVLVGWQSAHAALSVTPATWNVIGLDSNNVNAGPNTYLVGVRVCNTGGAPVNNIVGTLVWDSFNVNINTSGFNPVTFDTLAAGQCTNLFFNVTVTRTTAAYNTARRYHINVTADGEPTYTTPTPREVFVEKLVSQNRNETISVTYPPVVIVGQTTQFVVTAKTAPGGYEQLETFLSFPNTMFQVLSISTNYGTPAGATNNQIYADACGWQSDPTLPNYRSCVGPANYSGGKAGDTITTTYTVRVIAAGTTSLNSMIYDFSGSSYHYGNTVVTATLTAQLPPNVALVKSVSPSGTQRPGTDLTYTINFSNTGDVAAQQLVVTDPVPANTDFKVGSVTTTLGGLTGVTVAYSNNGGLTYAYTPTSGGGGAPAGYDRNVTGVRWSFSGALASGNSGNVTFTVRIR